MAATPPAARPTRRLPTLQRVRLETLRSRVARPARHRAGRTPDRPDEHSRHRVDARSRGFAPYQRGSREHSILYFKRATRIPPEAWIRSSSLSWADSKRDDIAAQWSLCSGQPNARPARPMKARSTERSPRSRARPGCCEVGQTQISAILGAIQPMKTGVRPLHPPLEQANVPRVSRSASTQAREPDAVKTW